METASVVVDESTASGVYPKEDRAEGGWGIVRVADRDHLVEMPLVDGALVGSGRDAGVLHADPSAGAAHARFAVRADAVYVEEIGNTAGVWVDGVRAERMEVAHGSVVRMGALLGIFVERDLGSFCGRIGRLGDMIYGPRNRTWVNRATAHARACESFMIEGGPGVGKATLARAVVREAGLSGVTIVDARAPSAKASVCDALALRPSTVVVLHIEHLDRVTQVEVVRVIKRTPGTVLIGTLGRSLEQALSDGLIAPAVASLVGARRVSVPSQDARREDIPAVLVALCERDGIEVSLLTVPLLEQFMRGGWPGGIRELRDVLRDVCNVGRTDAQRVGLVQGRVSRPPLRLPLPLQQADPELARARLRRALDGAGGTIAAAARELRVSRQAFYREVKRLNVELPKKKGREASAEIG